MKITLYLNEQEKEKIEKSAEASSLSVSSFARVSILEKAKEKLNEVQNAGATTTTI